MTDSSSHRTIVTRTVGIFGTFAVVVAAVGLAGAPTGAATPAPTFEPLDAPLRIADTRADGDTVDGEFEKIGQVTAGQTLELQVAGRAGVPGDASAAVLNVTAVFPAAAGFITVHPCDADRPNSSNLNYQPGEVVANAVFAGLDGQGKACIFSLATVDVVVDVTGSFPAGAFDALDAPQRIADTRPGETTVDSVNQGTGKVGPDSDLQVQVAGRAGVGSDATTAVLNVTVTDGEGPGFFTVYPCDESRPTASNLNHLAGQVVPNSVTAKLDADGRICVYSLARAHVIVDVAGTLPAASYSPLAAPLRLVDSRPGEKTIDSDVAGDGFRRAGSTLQIPVGGRAGIPAEASAVIFNVTVTQPTEPGFLTLHPRGTERPLASNVNFGPGQTVANTVVAPLGVDGMVCLFTLTDTEVIVDVAGYFTGPPPPATGPGCPIEVQPGTHPVGEYHVPPGLYTRVFTDEVICEGQRWLENDFNTQVGQHVVFFSAGRLIIEVKPTDGFLNYRFDSCDPLVPYVPPAIPKPADTFGEGIWIVGVDIQPGTYQHVREPASVCTGQRLSSFDGADSSVIEKFEDAAASVVTFTIKSTDVGFLSGCPKWDKIS